MDDDSLHSLLAKGRLSGSQRDRILDRVLDEHARRERPARRWLMAAGITLPIAAAVLLAIGPKSGPREPGRGEGWLVAKGEASGALLEAHCENRATGTCKAGDRLIFSVDGAKGGGFFAGYAVCASSERIWYFPTADGALPSVPAGTGHFIVDQAARIGPEHRAGRCTLHLFLLERQADRDSLLAGTVPATKTTIVVEVSP